MRRMLAVDRQYSGIQLADREVVGTIDVADEPLVAAIVNGRGGSLPLSWAE
jgi:hypothetical protein